jgi:methionine-rich copper-binding protein CopC
MPKRRLFRPRRLTALLALLVLMATTWPAWAHAELVSSRPAPGESVPATFRQLRLTFNEPLNDSSQVAIFGEAFQAVAGVTSAVDGPDLLVTLAAALPVGTYTVQWTAVGADLHPVEGTYQFAVVPPLGAGWGPRIVFISGLVIGSLALAALVILARVRRRRV